jgi:pseudaminic acid cytidylyltransferase
MSVLGIVPARGGSKRIPDKNIIPFCGRPMLSYVLEAARASGIFDKIHVSTDSDKIATVAAELGFKPDFMRDATLADDFTPLLPVLKWVVDQYAEKGMSFDTIFLLMPCAPLLEAEDLKCGLDVFREHGGEKPLMAVAPYPVPVEWAFEMESGGALKALNAAALNVRSQDIAEKYYDAGVFDIYSSRNLAENKNIGEHGFVSIKIAPHTAIDIDTPEDLVLAEALYRGLHTNPMNSKQNY